MIVTFFWESPSWTCYVQEASGARYRVETPSETGATNHEVLEKWARQQWPQARIEFDEYLM